MVLTYLHTKQYSKRSNEATARYRRIFWGGGTFIERFIERVKPTSPNLVRTQGNNGYTRNLFQSSDMLLHFQTRAAQSWVIREWCWKRRQISHFLTPCENQGRNGRDLYTNSIIEALPTTEPPEYISINQSINHKIIRVA